MTQEKRLYGTPSEMKLRLANFKATLDRIDAVNSEEGGYTAGLNQFSDMSPEEFAAKYLMKNLPKRHTVSRRSVPTMELDESKMISAPESIDLREMVGSNVPPIKDQQACGSCYAFAATTCIEYTLALSKKSGHKYDGPVSPQEFVDCTGVSFSTPVLNSDLLGTKCRM
jgi:C1A family cysteine protease